MDLITQLEDIPLDGIDLESMSDSLGNIRAMSLLYKDLRGHNLSSLFHDVDVVYVLYDILNRDGVTPKATVGHWICIIKNPKGLFYYDPYGLSISEDLHITGEPDYFGRVFKGIRVDANTFRHQKFRDHTNTCGRHCVSRALFWFLSNKEYNDMVVPILRHVSDLDVYVSILTAFLDHSDKGLLRIKEAV